jgi:hypothetical protein
MSKIILTLSTIIISLFSFGQVVENREVADFSKLKVSNSIDVYYTISSTKSLKIETDDEKNLQFIKTETVGETLKIYIENDSYNQKGKNKNWKNKLSFKTLKVIISGPNLDEIKASSSSVVKILNINESKKLLLTVSSSATIKGNFKSDIVTLDTSSSSTFTGEIMAKEIAIETSSSSTVSIEGKAKNVVVKASSSGDCNLKDLKTENATATASSSASISVYASNSINAKASSSGSISFYGNPSNISKEKSSGGSVIQK